MTKADDSQREAERSPAFQFYAKDWFDWKVVRMSDAAQGIYIKLLAFCWKDSGDQCSLTNNDDEIAKVLNKTKQKWIRIRKEIMWPGSPLFQTEGDRLISKRLRKEANKQRLRREKLKKAGSAGAKKRWHGHKGGHSDAIEMPMAIDSSSLSSSSSSSNLRTSTRSCLENFGQEIKPIITQAKKAGVEDAAVARVLSAGVSPAMILAWLLVTAGDRVTTDIKNPTGWFLKLAKGRTSPPDARYHEAKLMLRKHNTQKEA